MMESAWSRLFCPHSALLPASYKLWSLFFSQLFYPSATVGMSAMVWFVQAGWIEQKNVIMVMNWTCLMWKGAFQTTHFPLRAATLHWCPSFRPFLKNIVKQKHCFDSYRILNQITDFRALITRLVSTKLVMFYFGLFFFLVGFLFTYMSNDH